MKTKRSSDLTPSLGGSCCGGSSSGTEYDVFLSFRGPDTRYVFTDFLYEFMTTAGIRVFLDDEGIRKGEEIGQDLLWAINNSRFFVPIFSKNYASSKWCLRELAAIVESTRKSPEKEILPIFYHVDPSDVKLISPLYSDALLEHEKNLEAGVVREWRETLIHVSRIKGWHLKDAQGEGKLIKQIANEISTKLKLKDMIMPNVLIGLDYQVKAIMNLLDYGSTDIRFIVIHGMSGIGKTTLAKAIFNTINRQFQRSSFLSNVREFSSQGGGILGLQKQLLRDILNLSLPDEFDENEVMHRIRKGLSNENSLIVLDDVNKRDQIKNLVGMGEWLKHGSRVIITTRDLSCVPHREENENSTSNHGKRIIIYEMRELAFDHALQLFSEHAFSKMSPPFSHEKLSREVLHMVGGIPLALEVIGSYLCCKSMVFWEEALKKLKKAPHKDICSILMMSYEELEEEEREIFLDIACFFSEEKKTNAFYYWEACDLFPKTSVSTLVAMSLVKTDSFDKLSMHDLLKDFGKDIVRRESIQNPGRRSRLWLPEDVTCVLQIEMISENVKALRLNDQYDAHYFTREELQRLPNLSILELHGGSFEGNFKDLLFKLRWLSWDNCPSEFQATNFYPRNLVVLKLSGVNITDNWDGWKHIKMLKSLKALELNGHMITRTPDLSSISTLERLVLSSCDKLAVIDQSIGQLESLNYLLIDGSQTKELSERVPFHLPRSIGRLKALTELLIANVRLGELPVDIGELKCLKNLALRHCSLLEKLPDTIAELSSLQHLDLYDVQITELPESIGKLKKLESLSVGETLLRRFPTSIGTLPNVTELSFSCNYHLQGEFPGEFGELQSLSRLDLSETSVQAFSPAMSQLPHLQYLHMEDCDEHAIRHLAKLPVSLVELIVDTRSPMSEIPNLSHLTNLTRLLLSERAHNHDGRADQLGCSRNLSWVQNLQKLQHLQIRPSPVAPLSTELGSLSELSYLRISCPDPSYLQLPPNLVELILEDSKPPAQWQWKCHYDGGSLLGIENFLWLLTYTQSKGLELDGDGEFCLRLPDSNARMYDLSGFVDWVTDGSCPSKPVEVGGEVRQSVPDASYLRKLLDSGFLEVEQLDAFDMDSPWTLQMRFY